MSPPLRSYDRVALVYDLLAAVWSGGAIRRAASAATDGLEPGRAVLIAGVGGGRDAAAFARAGARLTLVDLSPRMLAIAAARVRSAGGAPGILETDVRALAGRGVYDLVCAHYFLNVFGPAEMPRVLAHLVSHLRVGGLLSVADFAPPSGRRLARLVQQLHYVLPLLAFRMLGLCADHGIYDYARHLPPSLELEAVLDHRVFGIGPRWHRTWLLRRIS